jgi:[lysine-biosynthesis-protein LysW]---L-2-aminoadipate ligase
VKAWLRFGENPVKQDFFWPATGKLRDMRLALIAHRQTETNLRLIEAAPRGVEMAILTPAETLGALAPSDVALARLDVLPTLDGIEHGGWEVARLEADGVQVLNRLRVLLSMHDKLLTARLLHTASIAHPRTLHVVQPWPPTQLEPPVVVKPRFGSWGSDVALCRDRKELQACLTGLAGRRWFRRHGVLVQELVPPVGRDLRVVVAAGQVVGAVERVAAPGEWRTNIALGGTRRRVDPPLQALELALAAAAVAEADLTCVDLLPTHEGGWVVIELNGAVEFNDEYSLDRDVFAATAEALAAAAFEPRLDPLAAVG